MIPVEFAVVTQTHPLDLAMAWPLYSQSLTAERDDARLVSLLLTQPVFTRGELLLLDSDGREVGWPGRKPSKWRVQIEVFAELDQALERLAEVPPPDYPDMVPAVSSFETARRASTGTEDEAQGCDHVGTGRVPKFDGGRLPILCGRCSHIVGWDR